MVVGGVLLVDVVMFAGERDMLQARMETLGADITVVVEGDKTFTGIPRAHGKPDLPRALSDRIVYVPVVMETSANPWDNEFAQRRAGFDLLDSLGVPDDAVVGLFDVDEIPDPVKIRETVAVSVWCMAKYQMSAQWFQQFELTGVSGLFADLRGRDVATVRQSRGGLPVVEYGWHLSSFMSLDDLLAKWAGFSHQELVRLDMPEWVAQCWREGRAVESGAWLTECGPTDIPQAFLDGPKFWSRGRDA